MQLRFIPQTVFKPKSSQEQSLENLLEKIQKKSSRAERALVRKAYYLAEDAHKFQKRLSGEPYITHPLAVAHLLADLDMDHEAICAGLLHDVLEDTAITRDYLEKEFGPTITQIVDGVTKISVLKSKGSETAQANNIRKIILATVQDARVLIVKLADKLHNLRTLSFHTPEKVKRIAQEALEIYAPLAGRLGIYKIKAEMEDLCLYYLKPEEYQKIKAAIAEKKANRDERVNKIIEILQDKLREEKIKAKLEGRSKHFYSIYKKIYEQKKDLDEIYDLTGVRVLVDSVQDCYAVLGIVHTLWNPIPNRFKDYISVPKSNGYQSLHTTVVGPEGKFLEVQIRTFRMHQICEYGIAAHWAYKEKENNLKSLQEQFRLLQNIATVQEEGGDAHEFMEELKTNLSVEDEVYVFSPKGEIFSLPAGSTVLDFAFRIHTELGLKCAGAKVQDRLISIRTPLKSGDQVTILTSPHVQPSPNWLRFLKTPQARAKLRAYFRRNEPTEAKIEEKKVETKSTKTIESLPRKSKIKKACEPIVEFYGETNLPHRLARCCNPQPGDAIIGFITRQHHLSVHKKHCPALKALTLSSENISRLVSVHWRGENQEAVLLIEGEDRPQIYLDLVRTLAEAGANIIEAKAETSHDGKISDTFRIEFDSEAHLEGIIVALKQIPGVSAVKMLSPDA
ncbi:MAG: bifunctional (p)ppGpp synthetase/guanosine-3',5'-bis(diphosphate) 3'-pyrophosphohydrolase [Leptospiraceae bacterium]|nr:bifunctional (p)ppGpp synthetase/guanosine-3',5'-bis(diphosphate) 3'-pyrophosphohydrolase [Leptospiraceae bacterium]MDW8306114.1 bifunctional (p)ppGpp synthetase/guanosine-3',5'-bis(diphosphate) 3'-pyrophosphohydrolase [Leptospiraceae bacterium]